MYEKEMSIIQKKIVETVKNSAENPEAAVERLRGLQTEAAGFATDSSAEYYNASSAIMEAVGDIWLRAKKVAEAEKAYIEMTQLAEKAYEIDKEKNDFRLGVSYYRRASFYRTFLGCNLLSPTPKILDEKQKKLFDVTDMLYKKAVACTLNSAKKGGFHYVKLHADCMGEMAVLHAAVGNYQNAVNMASDGVKLDKVIYAKLDDKAHSFRLANRMNTMVNICIFMKDVKRAMETMEDSIFVQEEHAQEDPKIFYAMLGRSNLMLGNLYLQIEEERGKAEAAYKEGLRYMIEANEKAEDRLIDDVITGYMIVGDYYKRCRKTEAAKSHYQWAMKKAQEMYQITKAPKYDQVMKRLLPHV